MKINAQFDQRVVVHSKQLEWIDSPITGVSRRPLDRVGGEVARATSIVRYAPGSQFSPHVHTGGEEFIVLDGVFQDEHGDFPVGSYIRNPPESSHTPGSESGCIIFVKLWQFQADDRKHIRTNFNLLKPTLHHSLAGVSVIPLYNDEYENVEIQDWEPGISISLDATLGIEILVIEGSFAEGDDRLNKQSWLRLPVDSKLHAIAGPKGARVWIKQHHLCHVQEQINRVLDVS